MNLGETIKRLRQERSMTQEQLAEYLNVSVSAISQWETGRTAPDISTLPVLADFFDISLDNLFDRTYEKKDSEIEAYRARSQAYRSKGETEKDLALWREATQKYPMDFSCLSALAHNLFQISVSGSGQEAERDASECIAICKRILRDCTEQDLRNSAIQKLVLLYSMPQLPFASEDEAARYAQQSGSIYTCRNVLLEHVYYTKESREKQLAVKHQNLLTYMDLLTSVLCGDTYDTAEDRIRACLIAVSLWNTLIYDGNFLFYHVRLQSIYLILAELYAAEQRREETIAALQQAFRHAKEFDGQPEGTRHYTSNPIRCAVSNRATISTNSPDTLTEGLKKALRANKAFDFLRNDREFLDLETQ
ncbi:MAG TPA: hypothetical protein DDW30_02580 [Clostridiales bacterium]|nr:hypothetical protein [Clostridiales bacterium]